MDGWRAGLGALLLAAGLAGCASDPDDEPGSDEPAQGVDHDLIAGLIGEPIVVEHDHTDGAAHRLGHNLEFVAWSTFGVELGQNGFANFVFYQDEDEDLAFMAVDGDTRGGFVIADVSNPRDIRPLGSYLVQGNGFQEVRVVFGGRYALLNVQEVPTADQLAGSRGAGDCSLCIHVVDIRDRAHPTLASVFPVDIVGTHNMDVEIIGDAIYVFYVGQSYQNSAAGKYVGIARFVETDAGAYLVKVAQYAHEESWTDPKRSFPHDVDAEYNPLARKWVAYVSHWEGGAITVDVSDPLRPQELAVHKDPAPSDVSMIHWFSPEPRPRGDRLIAWSAPEIGQLDTGSGVIRSYDVTDPADVRQVGTWTLPGNVTIPGQFLMSPHITIPDVDRGLLAVSHYHAGV